MGSELVAIKFVHFCSIVFNSVVFVQFCRKNWNQFWHRFPEFFDSEKLAFLLVCDSLWLVVTLVNSCQL